MLQKYSSEGEEKVFSHEAQRALLSYHWPGNVRELENVIQRALIFSLESIIEAEHLVFDECDTPLNASAQAFYESREQNEESLGNPDSQAMLPPKDEVQAGPESPYTPAWQDGRANSSPAYSGDSPAPMSAGMPMVPPAGATPGGPKDGSPPTSVSTPEPSFVSADHSAPSFGSKGSEVICLNELVKTNEKQMILAAIESSPTKAEAARRLGISPRTLRYKMAQLRMAGAA
jgi:two-component system response regulator FlrC